MGNQELPLSSLASRQFALPVSVSDHLYGLPEGELPKPWCPELSLSLQPHADSQCG